MMVRFPVPEGDPFLFAEQRPDKPIWTGKKPRTRRHQSLGRRTRRKHVDRNKTTADEVRIGTTTGEYNEFRNLPGWAINEGADHAGVDTNAEHAHLKIARNVPGEPQGRHRDRTRPSELDRQADGPAPAPASQVAAVRVRAGGR